MVEGAVDHGGPRREFFGFERNMLLKATVAPSFEEIRRAIISFYHTCPDPLREFLKKNGQV